MKFKIIIIFLTLVLLGCSDTSFDKSEKLESESENERTDEFVYSGQKLDILFIVDNSMSMYSLQPKLAYRLHRFTRKIQGLDWRLAFFTTDMSSRDHNAHGRMIPIFVKSENRKIPFLTSETRNYHKLFLENVYRKETVDCAYSTAPSIYGQPSDPSNYGRRPSCPSSFEQPLSVLQKAIEESKTENKNFFRSDAFLIAVILTDDDEEGNTTADDVLQTFVENGVNKDMLVYGIINKPRKHVCRALKNYLAENNPLMPKPFLSHHGCKVMELIQKTEGMAVSIDSKDYTENMEHLLAQTKTFKHTFSLSKNPNPHSIHVETVPQRPLEFSVNERTVTLKTQLNKGERVYISYDTDESEIEKIETKE